MNMSRFFSYFFSRPVNAVCGLVSTKPQDNDEDSLVDRIKSYRACGSAADGIHVLYEHKIDKLDYALMGSDNSCAEINNPSVSREQLADGRWFACKEKEWMASECPSHNSHSRGTDRDHLYVESFYAAIPHRKYQSTPEEVVWHYKRVMALRKNGTPQQERVRIMTQERASKPWKPSMTTHQEEA